MASENEYKLKVKVNNNNDTRLWRYSSINDYQGLCKFITTTWNNDDYIAQYEDDEGDLITIASKQDLKDAFDFAKEENKKSLKIFVQNYVKQKREENKNAAQQQQQQQSEQKQNEQAAPKQFNSTREMVFDFLSNREIVRLLPEFFGVLITKLLEKGSNLKEDEIVNLIYTEIKNDKFSLITSHVLYLKYGVLVIPYVASRIAGQQSLYPHFRLNTIKNWINQLIQMLIQVLQQTELTHGCSFKDIVIDIQYPPMTDTGKVIHFGVECDLCGQYPIIGDRYKCSICEDWDCCPKCEPKHDHPLIKFKKSSRNHQNASFKGLTEIMKRLSPENDDIINNKKEKEGEDLKIDDIDIYDDMIVDCICGSKMECVLGKKAYKWCNTVFCDGCNCQLFNEMVYHCPKDKDERFHKNGYDLCPKCANKKVIADAEKEAAQQAEDEQDEDIIDVNQEPPKEEPKEEEPKEEEPKQEQVEVEADEAPKEEAPKEEEFEYQAQLDLVKQIMAINSNDTDDLIKQMLIENKGDIARVVPLLLQ